MAATVLMPKLGNTVESSVVVAWRKAVGDTVAAGEVLCEVETDKATVEVESTAAGVVLALLAGPGDDVPVLAPIAVVGQAGETFSTLAGPAVADAVPPATSQPAENGAKLAADMPLPARGEAAAAISPRARRLAGRHALDLDGLRGTGPAGRIIERDVLAALSAQPALTPVARKMVEQGEFVAPERGSGAGGRITKRDLLRPATPEAEPMAAPATALAPDLADVEVVPVRGVRRVIAERMLASLQTTAQLTLNGAADARALLAYRQRLKSSPEALGLREVTLNDLILFVVARVLPRHPDVNALFADEAITRHKRVQLGFAVDTPRGLMVPVVREAHTLSLRQLSREAKRLAAACLEGRVTPDELSGGTFTVSNLGAFGVESFTPVLNPPQVAILGVGNINLRAVEMDGAVQHVPHLGLSLTINHQVVDGAPGARFLQAVAQALKDVELMLAV